MNIRLEIFISQFTGFFFQIWGQGVCVCVCVGGGGGGGKALKMTSQLVIFRAFFNISRTKSKTSNVNQQSVLNLQIFHNILTLNSGTLQNTPTKPQKYIIFFNETNNI